MSHPGNILSPKPMVVISCPPVIPGAASISEMKSCENRNSAGMTWAKLFRHKFTYIAPCWYQLRKSEKRYVLSGQHDVDQAWMKELRIPLHQVHPSMAVHVEEGQGPPGGRGGGGRGTCYGEALKPSAHHDHQYSPAPEGSLLLKVELAKCAPYLYATLSCRCAVEMGGMGWHKC